MEMPQPVHRTSRLTFADCCTAVPAELVAVPVIVSVYDVEPTASDAVLIRFPQPEASVATRAQDAAATSTNHNERRQRLDPRRAKPAAGNNKTASTVEPGSNGDLGPNGFGRGSSRATGV